MYHSHSVFLSLSLAVGEIINLVALDREEQAQHVLRVMVTDQGRPRLNTTTIVRILVTDVNDNPPQFTHLPATKELNVQVIILLLENKIYKYDCTFYNFIIEVKFTSG